MAGLITALRVPAGCGADGEHLFALRRFAAGEPILVLEHVRWRAQPDPFTVEHVNGHHFYDPILALIAHADDPNARLSTELVALIARRDVEQGEMLTRNWRAADRAALRCADGGALPHR